MMLNTFNVVSKTFSASINLNQVRCLYSPITLGLDTYVQQRERTSLQLGNIAGKFKTKMADYVKPDSTNMVFTEDLKNMVHLAKEEDIELVSKMLEKFNEQNKQLRFGSFVFGPVVMRMFYHLKKPKEALESFKQENLKGIYDQLITYQILMDLLYESKMYDEVLRTGEIIIGRQLGETKYPRNVVVLLMAACYKLNTPESLQYAINLWKSINEAGHFPMRRAVTFFAGLAVNHKKYDVCLEILTTVKNQGYITIRNLKAVSLCHIGRIDESLAILKTSLLDEGVKQTYCKDVMNTIKTAVENSKNLEQLQELQRIEKYFQEHGLLSEQTLDQCLCSEIQSPPHVGKKQPMRPSRDFRPQMSRPSRPGLEDIV